MQAVDVSVGAGFWRIGKPKRGLRGERLAAIVLTREQQARYFIRREKTV
jgi:hypothetical protein